MLNLAHSYQEVKGICWFRVFLLYRVWIFWLRPLSQAKLVSSVICLQFKNLQNPIVRIIVFLFCFSISMATHIPRMDCEDQETISFHSYPCAYYVQSPSTISHSNSCDIRGHATIESAFHSPTRSETNTNNSTFLNKKNLEVSNFTLSRYSSRGSNNSFLHDPKKVLADDHDGPSDTDHESTGQNRLIIVDHHDGVCDHHPGNDDDDEDDGDWYYGSHHKKGLWWRYFSFRRSNSCAWISLQIGWRLLLSLAIALLVFYISTKPPSPKISIKVNYSTAS